MRVLFVLKYRESGLPGAWNYSEGSAPLSSGLSVSVDQVVTALSKAGIEATVVHVADNNQIHREVVAYKATHVVVEGFWVVPPKFDELKAQRDCQGVKWIVRCHSNTEFLAHEGMIFGWALEYLKKGVTVAFNSPKAAKTMQSLAAENEAMVGNVVYLPNYYNFDYSPSPLKDFFSHFSGRSVALKVAGDLNIGCFGAIRPLKNHMNQAIAATLMAKRLGLKLKFHVNSSRVENQADPLLRALKALFVQQPQNELIEVPWMDHDQFLVYTQGMDMVTQVSMSETFNIVCADAVASGVPIIGANIPWLGEKYQARPDEVQNIQAVMYRTWLRSGNQVVQQEQRRGLANYVKASLDEWLRFLRS